MTIIPRRMWICRRAVLVPMLAAPARTDFIISIGSPTIPQGGTGTLDVFLTSTAGSSSPDLLNNDAFTLQITGTHELQFSTAQSFGYLTNSQYVFAGDSTAQMTASAGGTVPSVGTVYANDTFIGNDSTYSGNPVSLPSANTSLLLAALALNAAITSPGDSYSIKLVPARGNGSMNTSMQTFFDVVDFANTELETSAVPFTSASGTVLIGRASVPEPASLVSGLIGIIALAGFCGVRRVHRLKVSWGLRRQATAMPPAPRAAARLA